jgi:hypothetical protein
LRNDIVFPEQAPAWNQSTDDILNQTSLLANLIRLAPAQEPLTAHSARDVESSGPMRGTKREVS